MTIPGNATALLLPSTNTQYKVERSLRFNSSDSAYLSRTPASAGNRKTWTWAGWVKRSAAGTQMILNCDGGTSDTTFGHISFITTDQLVVGAYNIAWRQTTAVFRDFSAWYHVVVAFDTTQATASNRVKVYVNGVELTDFASSTNPNLNTDYAINQTQPHNIGRTYGSYGYFSGYLADIHFIDGQALTPSSFTEVSATTGQLIPKKYTGTFTGNSFWLPFSDNSSTTSGSNVGIGKDFSGLGNYWNTTNLSVTAGAGNDSLTDTPTSYGTDTGAGGEVRGNYATLNPLSAQANAVLANGNLDWSRTNTTSMIAQSTIAMSSGKWYCEFTSTTGSNMFGLQRVGGTVTTSFLGGNADSWGYYRDNGNKYNNNTNSAYGASYTDNDVIGVAFDADNGTLTFYKNGVSQGQAYSGLTSGPYTFALGNGASGATASVNFGQRPWAFPSSVPSGFRPLVDTCLPAPVVAKASSAFDAITWTGNGSSQSITLPGGFSPDLVWLKQRNGTEWHGLFNTIVGATTRLFSNSTNAEATNAQTLTAFNSNGFSVGNTNEVNGSGNSYVAWCWDAGTTTSSNVAGSITSSVRANPSAGFSVVTYTGTGTTASVGHGLGIAPSLIICKQRNGTAGWVVYHKSTGRNGYLILNATDAFASLAGYWGTSDPSATVINFDAGGYGGNNGNGSTYVAYCFAPVSGYSSFGSYTGNGSTDGPFVYTGFRPRWVMFKRTDSTSNWVINDAARPTYNASNEVLYPNLPDQTNAGLSDAFYRIDILSNGFKIRNTGGDHNISGGTFIYAAFAENPFQYARAR